MMCGCCFRNPNTKPGSPRICKQVNPQGRSKMTTKTNNRNKFECPCLNWSPDDFKAMFEKMTEARPSKEGAACCQGLMEKMMKMCCETKPANKPENQ